jgi:hypothetical protein
MHKLQKQVSLLVSLTSVPGALFSIFLKFLCMLLFIVQPHDKTHTGVDMVNVHA